MSHHNSAIDVTTLSPEVIALLQASYGRNADKVVATIVTRSENPKPRKPSKLAAVKAAAIETAEQSATPHDPRLPVTVIEFPAVGTLDARGFLVAMRRATTRDEQIKAIAGYCGYDRHGDHGAQDLSARMMAQRELRGAPAPLPRPIHTTASAMATVKGYVHGMPDGVATKVADLLGRERLAAENLGMLLAIGKSEGTPEQLAYLAGTFECPPAMICKVHAALATAEQCVLDQIRAELATLNG